MLGVLVNVIAVIAGSTAGLFLGRRIPEKANHAVMTAIGLCTLAIGIQGIAGGGNTLVMIVALAAGTALGTWMDIDGKIVSLGQSIEKKKKSKEKKSVSEGFVTASLLFCVGSMTIVGSLNAGLSNDNSMLYAKSVLDLISSSVLASALGIGVLYSAGFVLVFQGALVLLAGVLAPVLSTEMIAAITCTGSVSILGLGLNLIGITKIKTADQLPALILAPVLVWLFTLLHIM